MMAFMAFPVGVRRTVHESMMPRPFILVRLFFSLFSFFLFFGAAGYVHLHAMPPSIAFCAVRFHCYVVRVENGSRLQFAAFGIERSLCSSFCV